MPELSRFLGIVIAMYYRDHGPANFHAIYGDFEARVNILTGQLNVELLSFPNVHWRTSKNGARCFRMSFSKPGRELRLNNRSTKLSHWSSSNDAEND